MCKINPCLVICGIDWWLERNVAYLEGKAYEEWEFKTLPLRPTGAEKVRIRTIW